MAVTGSRRTAWRASAVAALAVAVVVLPSCSGSRRERTEPTTVTTEAPATTVTTSSSSTTTVLPSTTTTARPSAPTAPASPEALAKALFTAWSGGDRAAAQKVAQADAVATLFARPWQAGDGWSFAECSGAAGSIVCTWQRPAGQQLLFRVQTGGPVVTVVEVRFQP